jgi:hypothetical protein
MERCVAAAFEGVWCVGLHASREGGSRTRGRNRINASARQSDGVVTNRALMEKFGNLKQSCGGGKVLKSHVESFKRLFSSANASPLPYSPQSKSHPIILPHHHLSLAPHHPRNAPIPHPSPPLNLPPPSSFHPPSSYTLHPMPTPLQHPPSPARPTHLKTTPMAGSGVSQSRAFAASQPRSESRSETGGVQASTHIRQSPLHRRKPRRRMGARPYLGGVSLTHSSQPPNHQCKKNHR